MAFAFVAAAHGDANATSITVNKPTGTVDNDIEFLFLAHPANEDPNSGLTGWTQLGTRRYDSGSGKSHSLYYRVASSEAASYTIVWATSGRSGGTIATYRDGFDTADPIDVVSDTVYTTSNATLRAAGMTVAAANSALIFFGGTHTSTSTTVTPPTNPATFAEDVDNFNSNSRFTREIASVVWTGSGATGDMDATHSASTSVKHAFAVALNVAAGGVTLTVAGAATAGAQASAGLSHHVTLMGAAIAAATASGALSVGIPLSGAAVAVSSADGGLALSVTLTGAAVAAALAAASLTVEGGDVVSLEGSALGGAAASATLSLDVRMAGAATGGATAAANIVLSIPLSGTAISSALASGALTVSVLLSGAALAGAQAAGTLQGGVQLAGAAVAGATASAAFPDETMVPVEAYTVTARARVMSIRGPRRRYTVRAAARSLRVSA